MATGRDAADVALTTAFGSANLKKFFVVSDEAIEMKETINNPLGAHEPALPTRRQRKGGPRGGRCGQSK
jgi:hypothetical protein